MAQKKVILKDGTDELLPKTSASMVFTESGQTVESALKNAGGGGTGGIDEEQLAQYLSQHEYVTQTDLDEANYLKPTSAITGYSKASNYTALAPTDTLNEALGKLEAGIGSGGAGGGGDNIYWLPEGILNLSEGATHEQILTALGGSLEPIFEAAKAGKLFSIKKNIMDLIVGSIPVNVYCPAGVNVICLSFIYYGSNIYNKDAIFIIKVNTTDEFQSFVKKIRLEGYSLNAELLLIASDSSSDTISTAVGGESGFKSIIKAVKDGNRLVIRGTLDDFAGMKINQDVQCSMYQEADNGDMILNLSGKGYGMWGATGGLLSIQYTKSSNTFSCEAVTD